MKINVGDTVNIKPALVDEHCGDAVRLITPSGKITWIALEDIESVAPRPLQVGDIVTWGMKVHNYEIVAIKGGGEGCRL